MTPYRRLLLMKCLQFLDLAIIGFSFAVATVVAYYEHETLSFVQFLSMRVKVQNFLFFTLFLIGGHAAFSAFGLYQSRRLSTKAAEFADILKASALGSAVLAAAARAFHFSLVNAVFVAVFWVSTSTLTIASRLFIRWLLVEMRLRGRNLRNVLIVGTNPRAIGYAKHLEQRPDLGYHLLGYVDDEWTRTGEFRQNGYPLVANFSGFAEYLRHHAVDEVVLNLPIKSLYQKASDILAICEEQGIIVRYLPDIFSTKRPQNIAENAEGDSIITVYPSLADSWQLMMKRVLDFVFSLVVLVVCSPIILVTAILIKLSSPGPAFFAQERVGLNKRRFRLYKFRTMIPAAEKMQAELETLNEMDGPVFKIKDDPRITPIGRFLRRTSIDELPQLFNVLKGDMSLVGPRPLPVRDYSGFDQDWHRRRLSIRPGITCLWQISGRNHLTFSQWMNLDIQYIDNWSLNLDLHIMLHTIPAVLRRTGAR